jgi:hypothetical protein
MSSSVVKMMIRVGKDEIPLGECHAAQARNLVKKEFASWQDGKLLILARPAFLKLMEDGDHWVRSAERSDISDRELDRRKIWFKEFMTKAALAVSKSQDDKPRHSPVSPAVPKNWADVKQRAQDCLDEISGCEDSGSQDAELENLWETVPDVSAYFGCSSHHSLIKDSKAPVVLLEDQHAEVLEVEKKQHGQNSVVRNPGHLTILEPNTTPLQEDGVDIEDPMAEKAQKDFQEELNTLASLWEEDELESGIITAREEIDRILREHLVEGKHITSDEEIDEILREHSESNPVRSFPVVSVVEMDDKVLPLNRRAGIELTTFSGDVDLFSPIHRVKSIVLSGDDEFGKPFKVIKEAPPAFKDPEVWHSGSPGALKDLEAAKADFDSVVVTFEEDEKE